MLAVPLPGCEEAISLRSAFRLHTSLLLEAQDGLDCRDDAENGGLRPVKTVFRAGFNLREGWRIIFEAGRT